MGDNFPELNAGVASGTPAHAALFVSMLTIPSHRISFSYPKMESEDCFDFHYCTYNYIHRNNSRILGSPS